MLNKLNLSLIFLMISSSVYADINKDAMDALIQQNYNTAVPLLEHLARQGDPNAQYNLAILYKRGLGVMADTVKSNAYFSNAAHRGLVDGYRKLSVSSIRPVSMKPVPELQFVGPQEWVNNQNPNYYTLQLA
ncbi:sel1 repeat family protein, partial [Beggiatoa alba]|nr:sel1 repeat family protein [Beggiatoa alba]